MGSIRAYGVADYHMSLRNSGSQVRVLVRSFCIVLQRTPGVVTFARRRTAIFEAHHSRISQKCLKSAAHGLPTTAGELPERC